MHPRRFGDQLANDRHLVIDDITLDPRCQPRMAMDLELVQEYADAMTSGSAFPPVTVFHDGGAYYLADGFHRIEAARIVGLDTIAAEVNPGTLRDAILHAVGANADHGKRRTNADKRRSVAMLLDDPEWSKWSDNEIARRCVVHHTTVGAVRRSLVDSTSDTPQERTYTDRWGNVQTMDVSRIGGRRYTDEEIEANRAIGLAIEQSIYPDTLPDDWRPYPITYRLPQPSESANFNNVHVSNNSGENEWYTPVQFIDAARDVMGGIDLDPASNDVSNAWIQASTFYTKDDNGLAKDWSGRVWMNPPYAQPLIQQFCEKVVASYVDGSVPEAIVLVNNATETRSFQFMAVECTAICFPKGRIRYLDESGKPANTPLQGQAFLYFGDRPERFADVFQKFGAVGKWVVE